MTWNELKSFINTLTAEEAEQNVILIDKDSDIVVEYLSFDRADDTIFYDPFGGIVYRNDIDEDEILSYREDASIVVEDNSPVLYVD